MIMIIDDTNNPKITHLNDNNSHKLQIMMDANSNFIEDNTSPKSIHQILCEAYIKLLKLDFEITKTYSEDNSNIIDVSLPIIYYGKNFVQRDNLNTFFKKLTNIDKNFCEISDSITKTHIEKLEKIILSELPVLLGFYLHNMKKKHSSSSKTILKTIYNPFKTFRTLRRNIQILKEIDQVFSISDDEECVNYIIAMNHTIENYLNLMGGIYYCDNILDKRRDINSIDMLIYSAYNAQFRVFRDDVTVKILFFFKNIERFYRPTND